MATGFIASSFDLFHAGHANMLEEAKAYCDYLRCGLNVNPENKKCVQTVFERYEQLRHHKDVDMIVPYESEEDLERMLMMYKSIIHVRFLGEDYKKKDNYTGKGLYIDENIKQFLMFAAARHIKFNYKKIADYYAKADSDIQKAFEDSALVIIDINDAILNGFTKLKRTIKEIKNA